MGWVKHCELALSAVRSQLRRVGVDPETVSAQQAHAVLDDLCRAEPDLVASQWYRMADERQLSRFYRGWQDWLNDQRWLRYLSGGPYGSLVKEHEVNS